MKRFLINVYTNWCGEDRDYVAIANDESEFEALVDMLSYDNFQSFDGFNTILEELFPEVEDEEYTEEMMNQAMEDENGYYGYDITPWDEERDEKEWEWYELIYDGKLNDLSS